MQCTQITLYVENLDSIEILDDGSGLIKYEVRRGLADLRLVNKAFCQSASPRLFRYFSARADLRSPGGPPLEKLLKVANSPCAMHLRHLDVELHYRHHPNNGHPPLEHAEELAATLTTCVTRLPNLRIFEVQGSLVRCPRDVAGDLARTFATAMRRVPLPNLTELDTSLPIAYDLGQFFVEDSTVPSPMATEKSFERLWHPSLFVTDNTTVRALDRRARPTKVAADVASLPNATYAFHLCRLVERAVNDRPLDLTGSSLLNINSIKLHSSLRLKSIRLENVELDPGLLISVLDQCRGSIRLLSLCRVYLLSGTWRQVLVRATVAPKLVDLSIYACGYSCRGTSSHLCIWTGGALAEDEKAIETEDMLDVHALGDLQRHVNSVRASDGRVPYSDLDFRHAGWKTFKSAMEEKVSRDGP